MDIETAGKLTIAIHEAFEAKRAEKLGPELSEWLRKSLAEEWAIDGEINHLVDKAQEEQEEQEPEKVCFFCHNPIAEGEETQQYEEMNVSPDGTVAITSLHAHASCHLDSIKTELEGRWTN